MANKSGSSTQKRISYSGPKHVLKKDHIFLVKTAPGTKAEKKSVSMAVVLRNILKVANDLREVKTVLQTKTVLVNGVRIKDYKFPVGLFDVIDIEDTKRKYTFVPHKNKKMDIIEIDYKKPDLRLSKIVGKKTAKGGKKLLFLDNGYNINIDKDKYKVNDVVTYDFKAKKIKDHYEFSEGVRVIFIEGTHIGNVGNVKSIVLGDEVKKGEIVVKTKKKEVRSLLDYVFLLPDDFDYLVQWYLWCVKECDKMSKEQAKESKVVEQKPVSKVEVKPKVEAKKESVKVEAKPEAKNEDKVNQGKAETKVEPKKEPAPIKAKEKQDKVADKATSKATVKKVKNPNNTMRELQLDKVVLHMCVGDNAGKLQNAKEILVRLTEMKPVETKAKTRLPKWGIKPGLPIGTKVTLRGKKAKEILTRVFKAYKNQIKSKSFDKNGNFALGVKEYIDIHGMKYDPKLGLLGFDVIVNLKRRGYRVKNRLLYRKSVGNAHKVTKEDAVTYVNKTFGVDVIWQIRKKLFVRSVVQIEA